MYSIYITSDDNDLLYIYVPVFVIKNKYTFIFFFFTLSTAKHLDSKNAGSVTAFT
jgi:hypothetical protein